MNDSNRPIFIVDRKNQKTPLTKQLEPEPPRMQPRYLVVQVKWGAGGNRCFRFPPAADRNRANCHDDLRARVDDPSTRESGFLPHTKSRILIRCGSRLSKNFFGRSRRARRPSDCIRIAWLCRAGGAVSASAETIPYIFCGRQL